MQSDSQRLFLSEVRKFQRTPRLKQDQRTYRGRNIPSSIEKLYNGDTNAFEPIPENREHHLHCIMPLIINIAKSITTKYTGKVEVDDAIQVGMIGGLEAIDRYYVNEQQGKGNVAKLSTYAYPYIEKYVNEYCWQHNSLLSSERSKWSQASSNFVNSGDERSEALHGASIFETSDANTLISTQEDLSERTELLKMKDDLFSCISTEQKLILFMSFGIGYKKSYKSKDIANKLNRSILYVNEQYSQAIIRLRQYANERPGLIKLFDLLASNKDFVMM